MTVFEKMRESGLTINWTTILVGWEGPGKFLRQLSVSEIASYAAQLLELIPEQPPEVLQLAGASTSETEVLDQLLRKLSNQEGRDIGAETRKWRFLLLGETLKDLGSDPLYGLLQLSEFWEKFDYPNDSPHEVQGRGNNYSPEDYYTDTNFQRIMTRHQRWFNDEAAHLGVHIEDQNPH